MKILCTGVTARAIAESAVHSGYAVIALDAFADLDLEALCECYALQRYFKLPFSAHALYRASQKLQFEAVAYTSNLENYPAIVRRFASQYLLLGNTPETLAGVRDWRHLCGVLAQAGFRTPDTIYHASERRQEAGHKWLRKPLRGGGGHKIAFCQADRLPGKGFMLQEYIPGLACSASFVSNGKEAVVIGLSEQLLGQPEFGAGGFIYCGNLVPLPDSISAARVQSILVQARRIATLVTREFGLAGVNGFDFILADDQVCLTEVNPRYSASMELIERAYELPIFGLHVQAVTKGILPDFDLAEGGRLTQGCYYGKTILYGEQNAQAPDTRRWLAQDMRDIPHPGEPLLQGKPVCTLLAEASSRDECFAHLVDKAEKIKGEIYG